MAHENINMTRYVVYRKVDEVVKNPGSPYDSAFANPYLRQKLLLRVLNMDFLSFFRKIKPKANPDG